MRDGLLAAGFLFAREAPPPMPGRGGHERASSHGPRFKNLISAYLLDVERLPGPASNIPVGDSCRPSERVATAWTEVRLPMRFAPMVCSCIFLLCDCSDGGSPARTGATSGTGGSTGNGAASSGGTSGASSSGSGSGGSTTGMSAASGAGSSGATESMSGAPSGDDSGLATSGTATASDGSAPPKRLAVTADFLNQTLSVVDLDQIQGRHQTVGRARRHRRPEQVHTRDRWRSGSHPTEKRHSCRFSGGWLGSFTTVPAGNGTLLFVDIATRTVTEEIYTGSSPMGIKIILPDGKHALVGQYSESYIALVDIEKQTYTAVPTRAQSFNEELAIATRVPSAS